MPLARHRSAHLLGMLALAAMVSGFEPAHCDVETDPIPDWQVPGFSQYQIYATRDLYKAMGAVGEWLQQRNLREGHCPESSEDIVALTAEITESMPENPFAPNSGRRIPIKFVWDDTLSEAVITHYRTKPPAGWQAPAGTITVVICYSHEHFLIWGAGYDQLPIRHETNQRLLFIKGKCR